MKKTIKTLLALTMALVMVLALGATAWAETPVSSGVATDDDGLSEITFQIELSHETYTPALDVCFEIFPANEAFFDYSGSSAEYIENDAGSRIYAGNLDAVNFGEAPTGADNYVYTLVHFDPSEDMSGTESGTLSFKINPDAFSGVGIYRYEFVPSLSLDQMDAGLRDGEHYAHALDVYVEATGDAPHPYIVKNAVIFQLNGEDASYIPDFSDEPSYPNNGTDSNQKVDSMTLAWGEGAVYFEKVVAGNMGDKTENFTFTVNIDFESNGAPYYATNGEMNIDFTGLKLPVTGIEGVEYLAYGNNTISLKHGSQVTLFAPLMSDVTITEVGAEEKGYELAIGSATAQNKDSIVAAAKTALENGEASFTSDSSY